MRIAVLSDTHITRSGSRRLGPEVYRQLEAADAILHAGDVVVHEVLEDLARFAPVHAVLGNNDREMVDMLPERLEITIEGVRVALVHDSGPRDGRARRMRRWFPEARLVVYGHSHMPVVSDPDGTQMLLNPGSPTDKRREPHFTMARLELQDGEIRSADLTVVDP